MVNLGVTRAAVFLLLNDCILFAVGVVVVCFSSVLSISLSLLIVFLLCVEWGSRCG
jgi:hypothetical protein